MFVPQRKDTMVPTINMDQGEPNPSKHGYPEWILHFWCKMKESLEQSVGEITSQERRSKSLYERNVWHVCGTEIILIRH